MTAALRIGHDGGGWHLMAPPGLPIDRLVRGRMGEAAAAIVPLVYNVCAAAQAVATRQALGLPVTPEHRAALRTERLREHHRKLWLVLPPLLGLPARGQPRPMTGERAADFDDWMADAEDPAAAVARHLAALPAGKGLADLALAEGLPDWPKPLIGGRAAENSLALELAGHPVPRAVEMRAGRGPLWRLALKLTDYTRLAAGALPADPTMTARGRLHVRAALDSDGRVTDFARLTPTDFMLAPGGVLPTMLRGVAPDDPDVALLIELADPCLPWEKVCWKQERRDA